MTSIPQLVDLPKITRSGFSSLDYVPDPILVLDKEDKIIFLNQPSINFQRIIQTAMAEGDYYPDMITASQKQYVLPLLQRLKKDLEEKTHELEYSDSQGRKYIFEILYKPVVDRNNNHELTYVIIREITREKILQNKTSRQAQDFSILIEQANAVIFSIDSLEYITDWNDESGRVTGYNRADVLAKQIGQFIADQSIEKFTRFLQEIFLKKTMDSLEVQFNSPDNSLVIVLLNATPKVNSFGIVIGVVFIGHDITELFSYRQSLEHIVKERTLKLQTSLQKERDLVEIKNRFVAMASHEFRIPLSNISSSVKYVRENAVLDKVAKEKLSNIDSQVGHMKVLIDDVLTIGKADTIRLKVHPEKFDLVQFLTAIAGEVRINANYSHEIKMIFLNEVVEIESDQKLLRNIFINLLSNAIKFSPDQPYITLTMMQDGGLVTIAIIDQGIGIAESDLSEIFEPYSRGGNVNSIMGTGLGLSIVKRAVDTLGGSLSIYSKLGEGTTITVSLKKEYKEG